MKHNAVNDSRVDSRAEPSGSAPPVWRLVCKQELKELWLGGRVLFLLILFSAMMSVTSVMQEIESQVSMIPPPEIVFVVLQATISFGLFIGLIVGADSISGERERGTLEALLLTPASRLQMVIGKFIAAFSPWPVAFVLSIPYLTVLSQGDEVLLPALRLGALMGTLLAVAFTGYGLLVSIWSSSNRMSLFASLLGYILLLIPTMWPGFAQKGDLGYLIQQLNPMQSTSEFLEKVLVNNRTVQERSPYMMAAIVSATLVVGLLFLYAAPRLRLEGGTRRSMLPGLALLRRGAAGLALVVGLSVSMGTAIPALAATPDASDQPMEITIDLEYRTVAAGEKIDFTTVVTNKGTQASAPFHVSMNIIKIGSGDPVDPEDWSPERSQAEGALAPGKSAERSWVVHGILEGNYMVYMTVVPTPAGPDMTTQTFSSKGLHVIVKPTANRNPGGVLPVAIAVPASLVLGTVLLRRRGRREAETNGADS
jgi:ABC-2 type transport system permease protein